MGGCKRACKTCQTPCKTCQTLNHGGDGGGPFSAGDAVTVGAVEPKDGTGGRAGDGAGAGDGVGEATREGVAES